MIISSDKEHQYVLLFLTHKPIVQGNQSVHSVHAPARPGMWEWEVVLAVGEKKRKENAVQFTHFMQICSLFL